MPRALGIAGLVVLALAGGCGSSRYAMVHGRRVARPDFGYTDGDLFALEHHAAYPGQLGIDGKFYVDDGYLDGRACGLELQFASEWYGARMMLSGKGGPPMPWLSRDQRGGFRIWLMVHDDGGGHRRISGSTLSFAPFVIDMDVSAERLVAQIDTRKIELVADGAFLVGRIRQPERKIDEPFAIYGRQMLRTMSPADEAIILLTMITCNSTTTLTDGRVVRGFSLVSVPKK
jgi:hypothetical protein